MKPYLLKEEEIKELAAKIPGWEIHPMFIERSRLKPLYCKWKWP